MVSCLLGRSRLFPGLPPSWLWCTSPLQAVFTQPIPVLSLGSDLRSSSLSSQPPPAPAGEQTSLSGWWVLVGTDPLCGNLSTLPSVPLLLRSPPWLWSFPPAQPRLCQWRGFLVCGNFSSFTAPSQWCRSHPYSFVSVFSFFFCPTQVRGEFLAFGEVWGFLPAFSRCSVAVVPHVDVFLMYLWGGRWSPRLTPPPSWRSPHIYIYIYTEDYIQENLSNTALQSKAQAQTFLHQRAHPRQMAFDAKITEIPRWENSVMKSWEAS